MQPWVPPRPDGQDDGWLHDLPPLPPVPPPIAQPRRSRRVTAAVSIGLALLLVVGAVLSGTTVRHPTPQERAGPRFTFIETTASGDPVRWNPCAPIHYVVNDDLAGYDTAIADVQQAACPSWKRAISGSAP